MRKILLLLTITFFSFHFKAQLVVDTSLTVDQLVQNILVGSGVQISNVTFNGQPANFNDEQCGSFISTGTNLGINGGVILGTGDVNVAEGPNDEEGATLGFASIPTSDADLDAIATNSLNDLAILEFDFIPVGESISFRYVFSSEEYNEYVCSDYNDVFGFFISGPGINGPYTNNAENIAKIPGTNTAVAINTVNLGVAGSFGSPEICDQIDPNWQAYSIYYNNNTANFIEYDGMTQVLTAYSVVQCGQTYHIKLAIADAGDGAYDSGVFLEAGSLSSTDIDFKFASVDGDTVFYENCTLAEFVFSRPENQIDESMTISLSVSGTASPGLDYSTFSNSITFDVGVDTVFVPFQTFADNLDELSETVTITAIIITGCGDTVEIIRSITINDPIRIDSITTSPSLTCSNTGLANAFTSNSAGVINYSWNGPGSNGPIVSSASSLTNSWSGWYYLTVDDDFCSANDSVFIDLLDLPIAAFSALNATGSAPLLVTFTNQSQNADSYEWIFGNGLDTTVNNLGNQSSLYIENISYTVTLIAFQQVCSDTITFTFELISKPSVYEPNIFTPNGDNINPNFTLNPINFITFDYSIFNRWGNLMFQGNLSSPNWNGMIEDKEAEEGVYFYIYSGVGINDESKSGQGFFHLKK